MKKVIPLLVILVLLAGAAAVWWFLIASGGDSQHKHATVENSTQQHLSMTLSDDPAVIALGSRIYAENCAVCHGNNLEGQAGWTQRNADGLLPASPQNESGHTWHHPVATLFAIIKEGPAALAPAGYRSAMPGFGAVLSDDQIIAVLSYIRSRWPTDIRARHDKIG